MDPDESPQARKAVLRRRLRELRAELMRDNGGDLSHQVCRVIRETELFRSAGTVAAYLSFGDELDLAELFGEPDKRFVVPRIDDTTLSLRFHILSGATLVPHRFGQREPGPGTPHVAHEGIELVLVPGLAFDLTGARLGYGKGYYDRFMAGLSGSVPTVGVTLDELLIAAVPHEAHDRRVSHIVTQSGLRQVTDL